MFVCTPKKTEIAYQLDASQSRALRRWWSGRCSEQDGLMALQVIERCHQHSHWIACDCIGANQDLPLLAPALSRGTLFLRRMTARAQHAEDCVFHFEQAVASASGGEQGDVGEMGQAPDFGPKLKGVRLSKDSRGSVVEKSSATGVPRPPKLAKQLWWLAQAAGWQSSTAPKYIESLIAVASKLPSGDGVAPLSKTLFATTRAWTEGWFENAIKQQQARCPDAVACAWWIFEVSDIDDEGVILIESPQHREGIKIRPKQLSVFGGDARKVRMPMVAIGRIQKTDAGVEIEDVYAHPCEGRGRWTLVDSDNEREALKDIKQVLGWLREKKMRQIDFDKPLFNWRKTGERPDFVLSAQKGSATEFCVIETMGFDTEEYIQRKAELRRNLLPLAEVIEDNRVSGADASTELKRNIARWALRRNSHAALFKKNRS